ncbi:Beta-13-galactosyl-O-glycosyl-glycoprotein beta-16-N-acetylglucosaminyltransferase [Taenia crassiceps]|uniref:Beta-13-galactosyl-O-glycosyl-glycoprotein beta-16-N-acetylglucosaminyltransferase n=1 Tax=Taenia crassiceps TaxID=6207 RepID=A0ABR4Q373_9CEST
MTPLPCLHLSAPFTQAIKLGDIAMKIRCRREVLFTISLGITTTAFILLVLNWTKMQRAVDEEDRHYFTTVNSPSHSQCLQFRRQFPIVGGRDGDMDIAFTLVVHKDPLQIARLLRMIYRENNYYCIHADAKSSQSFVDALNGIAKCFGANVQLVPASQRVEVSWGDESVLLPQLICAAQALRQHSSWRYLVNLVGQDFPLRTNLELIAALRALNGSNLIESFPIDEYKYRVGNAKLPLGATWFKGSIYGAYRREFLEETIHAERLQPIRSMIVRRKAFRNPDELFFPTFAYNPHLRLPGACLTAPSPSSERGMHFLAKYVIWLGYDLPCTTKYVRGVCILGREHVNLLKSAPHIAANKFHADYEQEAYDEMERWYFEKAKAESTSRFYSHHHFDPSLYARLSCSRNHL